MRFHISSFLRKCSSKGPNFVARHFLRKRFRECKIRFSRESSHCGSCSLITHEEPPKEDAQACAVIRRAKTKGPNRSAPPPSPVKDSPKTPEPKRAGKGSGKEKKGKPEGKPEKRRQQCTPFFRGNCKKADHCSYEHQVDGEGNPIPVGLETLQKYNEAVKRFNENKAQAKTKPAPRGGLGVYSNHDCAWRYLSIVLR